MNSHDIKQAKERIARFEKLEKRRDDIRHAIRKLTENWEHGPCGQGPFTSNTRESRQIQSLCIQFTPTRGGAPRAELEIDNLFVEASSFGAELRRMLERELETIQAAMEKV